MNTNVPAPPSAEAARQKIIHSLRVERVRLARAVKESEFTDNQGLFALANTNALIEGLRYAKEGYDMTPEPTVAEIEARSVLWYWEEWREESDEEEYE